MKVAFTTLGCKVNQYDTQALTELFADNGFDVVPSDEFADIYIINSCTVTGTGDKKTRQALHKAKKQNQNSIVALTGCFPQAFPEKAALILEADVITGTKNRASLLPMIMQAISTGQRIINISDNNNNDTFEAMQTHQFLGHTRAFVKIEDGCNRFCSYCIIPYARGNIRSKSLSEIKIELLILADKGYKEIVFVGINLMAYGMDINASLSDAVEIANGVDGIERIRLGSIEPDLVTQVFLNKIKSMDKFCPHFHLSLQSGSDLTLKRMNRKYTSEDYANTISIIRQFFPKCAVTSDVLVGFSGETDEEFKKSFEFIKKIGFSQIHIFPYSRREGTAAYELPGQISKSIKDKRCKELIELSKQNQLAFNKTFVGETMSILFEKSTIPDYAVGSAKNNLNVRVKTQKKLQGLVENVIIKEYFDDYCLGVII
jgi:threonylcarbamoyladenosine tRNA methylthiotransferase MtaB